MPSAGSLLIPFLPAAVARSTPARRLRELARGLSQHGQQAAARVALQDVSELRGHIRAEVLQSRVADVDMVSDQLLFLMLGALNMQARKPGQQHWQLVYASIDSLLAPPRPGLQHSMSWLTLMAGSLLLLGMFITTWMQGHAPGQPAVSVAPHASMDEVAPASLSMLAGVFHRMKDGDCQLPQAAMLPIAQRQPFLDFINDGKVEVTSIELLKSALVHVHCLYTKEQLPQQRGINTSNDRLG